MRRVRAPLRTKERLPAAWPNGWRTASGDARQCARLPNVPPFSSGRTRNLEASGSDERLEVAGHDDARPAAATACWAAPSNALSVASFLQNGSRSS
jgi:hypothetical protein